MLRVRSGSAASVAVIEEVAIFVLWESGLRFGLQAACVIDRKSVV